MNLKQLRSRIKTNLTQTFIDEYNLLDGAIDSVINSIYTRLAFNTQVIKNTYTINTTANQISYPLDEDFMLLERVYYDYDSTSGSVDFGDDLEEIGKWDLEGVAEYGTPKQYWLEQPHNGTKARIYFHPVPSTSSVVIRVAAIIYPNLLSADTDAVEMRKIMDEIIIHGSTAELGAIGRGIPNLKYWISQFETNMERARETLNRSSRKRNYRTTYREHWDN